MQVIQATLSGLTLGEQQSFRNLAVFPLFADAGAPVAYRTLDEALVSNLARVTEVSEGGDVPELAFENDLDERVLLVDGEELRGAKQNRILDLTILVGAGQKLVIPVSCVERGRWLSCWR